MSAYFSPNHNRLLDLENYLQRQQPVPRQVSSSARRSHPQPKHPSTPTLPSSPTINKPKISVPSDTYRHLAAQMGQHDYPRRRPTRSNSNRPINQPKIKPIKPALTTDTLGQNLGDTPGKNRFAQNELPTIPTPSTPPQQSWSGLAQSIRQARLGLTQTNSASKTESLPTPTPKPTSKLTASTEIDATPESQTPTNWVIDEIFTDEIFTDKSQIDKPRSNHAIALISPEEITKASTPVSSPTEDSDIKPPTPATKPASIAQPSAKNKRLKQPLKNSLLLLTYQRACPPQIVDYIARLSHQKQAWKKRPK